jgi:adenylate cyclase
MYTKMGVEIERTFIVDPAKLTFRLGSAATIEQAYLSEDPCVRVRLRTSPSGIQAFITIKGPGTIKRAEFEWPIPVKDAEKILSDGLWEYALVKRRFKVGRWEIDEFLEELSGLWLAEIELTSVDEPFERPDWLGREVSECPEYTNIALARDGLPTV